MTDSALPKSDSPDLHLVVATEEENLAQLHANSSEWRGALSLPAYLRREHILVNQTLTRDGGLTAWMLIYAPSDTPRRVLCGCESIKKKALLAKDGKVEDVVAHGVASVFCPPDARGKGYAGRMMLELGNRLKQWQVEEGASCAFSVLFSDIGKEFYKARGWQNFPSAHIALRAVDTVDGIDLREVGKVESKDLAGLCAVDEGLIRTRLRKPHAARKTAVALIPDANTLDWHYAREDFVANELYGPNPTFMASGRGAIVEAAPGSRVWCYWVRVWTNAQEEAPNTLHIMRLVVEDESYGIFTPASGEGADKIEDDRLVQAIAKLLAMATVQAHRSGMQEVQIWNPTSTTLAAARLVDADAAKVTREKESIAALNWYGDGSWEDLDWGESSTQCLGSTKNVLLTFLSVQREVWVVLDSTHDVRSSTIH